MTVMVPTENAGRAGLRRVIDEEAVERVLSVLRDDVSQMPKNWNRRFKHNRDKIKTGDVYELAEVVRNLAIRESDKGLSTGEKQMYTRAKKILASELMYALEMEEDEVEEHLDSLIEDAHDGRQNGAAPVASGSRNGAAVAAEVMPPPRPRRRAARAEPPSGPSRWPRGRSWASSPPRASGERLGSGGPKALVPCGGRPLLEWSLGPLRRCATRWWWRCPSWRGGSLAPDDRTVTAVDGRGVARRSRCSARRAPRPRRRGTWSTTPRARSSRATSSSAA